MTAVSWVPTWQPSSPATSRPSTSSSGPSSTSTSRRARSTRCGRIELPLGAARGADDPTGGPAPTRRAPGADRVNHVASPADRGFFDEVHHVFSRHGLPGTHDPVPTHEELVPSFVEEIVASPEFAEPSIHRYRWDQRYTARDYTESSGPTRTVGRWPTLKPARQCSPRSRRSSTRATTGGSSAPSPPLSCSLAAADDRRRPTSTTWRTALGERATRRPPSIQTRPRSA